MNLRRRRKPTPKSTHAADRHSAEAVVSIASVSSPPFDVSLLNYPDPPLFAETFELWDPLTVEGFDVWFGVAMALDSLSIEDRIECHKRAVGSAMHGWFGERAA